VSALAVALRQAGIIAPQDRLNDVVSEVMAQSADQWHAAQRESWDNSSHRERLISVGISAVTDNPRNWDGAKDALYKAVRNDADLLWALFEPYRLVAVQKLLTESAAKLREQERRELDVRLKAARSGQTGIDNRGVDARPAASPQSGMDARTNVVQLSLLDTFKINGRAIGDCTPYEAKEWASARERDARFVRLLTTNLPSNEPIRKYIRPEEVQNIYNLAEKQQDA
jgi:hypothetical protein